MADLPTGTVTFLFTDLEVSTRLWDQEPDAMRDALARHDAILRHAVESHDGVIVKGRGDGVHAVFATADAAVRAAIACELAVEAETWPVSEPLRVRIGIHTGVAELRDGDYFGSAVNRAARLEAIAHGGQVVCSQATAELARDVLAEGVAFVDLGEHRLRDLSRAERVYQVAAPGLAETFGALASLDAFPGNLPAQVSSFVGREREITRVADALGSARVVTLTGVGGVGKTRLACQVAAQELPRFPDGAWLVELAAVRDPDGIAGAFAAVFGVTARSGHTLDESLVEFLRTKQLLLVVDNCEHLLEPVGDLVELLERSCPTLVMLTTSREGLALDGERVVPVPSFGLPAEDAGVESAGRTDAVRLFEARASAFDPDFTLTERNTSAVVQVCRRLDGVPLAIELAAARITTMSPEELARGLGRRFETLAGGRRRAVQRHQTLRAAIDWSYELCSEPEQRLLARLAVFAGGWTRPAAEHVCAGDPIGEGAIFELLADLVAKSLVVTQRDGPNTRYRLLETIREYGEEHLAAHGETDVLRARHGEYYTEFVRVLSEQISGPDQIDAGRRLAVEHENLLAAMNNAIDTNDVDVALRLLRNVPPPPLQVGYELRLPVDALDLPGATEHPLYPVALGVAAGEAATRGELGPTEALCAQALAAGQRLGDPDRLAEQLVCLAHGFAATSAGAWSNAAENFERAADIGQSTGRMATHAYSLGGAAMSRAMAGDRAAAAGLATEGLAAARRIGMPSAIVANLNGLAAALAEDDPERARALLRESRQLQATLDYESNAESMSAVLTAARIEDWSQVLELAPVSIRLNHWSNRWAYLSGIVNVVARALTTLDAEVAAVLQGAARPLAVAALSLRDTRGSGAPATTPVGDAGFLTELRRATTRLLHEALGEARLRELRTEGEAMDPDQAAAYALAAIDRVVGTPTNART